MRFIRKNNNLLFGILLLFGIFFAASLSTNSSYAATVTKTFSRSQLQDYIVSTAISYYRNQNYSDYDQKGMDELFSYNGSSITTFMWRDFNVTPEYVSRTNNYHNDCSSFVSQSLIHSIGYDFSNYYSYGSNITYLFNNFKFNKITSSKTNFQNGNLKVGKGITTYFMNNFAYEISSASAGVEYTNSSSVINYYYKISGSESSSKKQSVINNIKSRLQPGDIVVYRHVNSSGNYSGHVILYAGTFTRNDGVKITGFIHSTGVSYDFDALNPNIDAYSVRTDTTAGKVDNVVFEDMDDGDTKTTTSYVILRPINYYCGSSSSCSVTVNSNSFARNDLKNLKIEQYMSSDNKNFSKYNSLNVGDELTYNLEIKNISDNNAKSITVSNDVPVNTNFVSCTNNCSYNKTNNTVTWVIPSVSDLSLDTYSYTVSVTSEEDVSNDGFAITTYNDNVLQMDSLNAMVNPTYNNDLSKSSLDEFVSTAVSLHNNGYIYYGTNGSSDGYLTDINNIDSNNKLQITNLNFVKFLYYNVYGIDLTSNFSKDSIKSSLFNYNSTYSSYSRKTSGTDNISKMLVPGLYGGRILRGNDKGDRTKYMVYNDLEVGDILVAFTSDANLITLYVYTGLDTNSKPVFVRISSSNSIDLLTGSDATSYFDSLYSKDLFVVLRPSRVYSLTINFDYDNSTKDGITSVINSKTGKYNTLPVPEKKFVVNYDYNALLEDGYPASTNADFIFDGWYNNDYSIKALNNSDMISASSHTLYAKYTGGSVTLPTPVNGDYVFGGWYKESTFENKIGNGGDSYTPTSDITLYAKWSDEITGEFDITSDVFNISNNHIYLTEAKNSYDTYKTYLKYDSNFNYQLKLYDVDDYLVSNGIVFTGSKLKVIDDNTLISEYINIVKGDVNGTGTVSMADVMKLVNSLFDESVMPEDYNKKAGDVTLNGSIGMNDVMKIVNYLLMGGNL